MNHSEELAIRLDIIRWVSEQADIYQDVIPSKVLTDGYSYKGEKIVLKGARGIWKPRQFSLPISISTSAHSPYDDSRPEGGYLSYKYFGTDPRHRDNVMLRHMMKERIPLVYFLALQKGVHMAFAPVFIEADDPAGLTFTVALDDLALSQASVQDAASAIGRQEYIMVQYKHRLHQSRFRLHVLSAYRKRCTICQLKHTELLDAAHIIPDSEERGEPVIQNGLSLCKIHHAAYDHNIMGISPDFEVSIRPDVLEEVDGPMLRYGLQSLDHQRLILPRRRSDWPDRDRLDDRYQRFLRAG